MSLKDSKTEQNLKDAFAGESQANRRYLYFAAKADVEGYNDVAAVFRSTAEGETGHAHGHLEYLEELDVYNPLIPDGSNWKATFMIEFPEADERQKMLEQLVGIEDRVYVQIEDFARVFAIADEDMDRSDGQKTSAVHFMRFELPAEQSAALKSGASLIAGIDHENYRVEVSPVADNVRNSLLNDLI